MQICNVMEFRVTHIFKKDHSCASRLTNLSMENRIEFVWYSTLGDCIRMKFFHNRFQLPLFCL